jgi:hypothetical protein
MAVKEYDGLSTGSENEQYALLLVGRIRFLCIFEK